MASARDVTISFATTAYIQALNIATGLLAARLLLPEGRGELAALFLWPGLIAELGGISLSDALLYRLSLARSAIGRIFATIMALALLLVVALVPVGLALLPWLYAHHDAETRQAAVWYMALFLPSYFASLYITNMFQGRLDLATWNLVRALVPTGYLLGIAALGLASRPEAPEFAAANLCAQALAALIGLALLARRGWIGVRPDRDEARAMIAFGLKSHASEILHSLRQKLDQAWVAWLLSASELGLYAVALTVANAPLILVQTVANIAFPRISATAVHARRIEIFGRYLRLTLAVVLAIDVVLLALNTWLVPLLFGRPFAESVLIADVLLLGLVPYGAKILFAAALKAWDRALAIPRAEIWGLVAAAILLPLLVPRLGLVGAAIAVSLSHLVSAIVLGRILGRELDAHPLRLMRPTRADLDLLREEFARTLRRA
jgi:O-antigen/teichoic acid export membrane protein